MKKMKFLAFLLTLSTTSLFSICPETYIDAFVGGQAAKSSYQIFSDISGVTNTYRLEDLRGWKVGLDAEVALGPRWYLRGMGGYGWITSGTFTQTGTAGFTSSDVKGTTLNLEAALGYHFYPTCNMLISPTIGWSYDNLSVYTDEPIGPFPVSFSRNKIQLGGPFVGADFNYFFNNHWNVFAQYELHLASSQTKLWTPAADVITLRGHLRNLVGNLGRVGIEYRTDCGWRFGLNGSYRYYSGGITGSVDPETIDDVFTEAQMRNVQLGVGEILLSTGYQF